MASSKSYLTDNGLATRVSKLLDWAVDREAELARDLLETHNKSSESFYVGQLLVIDKIMEIFGEEDI